MRLFTLYGERGICECIGGAQCVWYTVCVFIFECAIYKWVCESVCVETAVYYMSVKHMDLVHRRAYVHYPYSFPFANHTACAHRLILGL